MDRLKLKELNQHQRAQRTRAKITGTAARPRLAVHISNQHVIAQIIDDEHGRTLAYSSSAAHLKTDSLSQKATNVGNDLARAAKKAKIKRVVFDRGHLKYHGRLKGLADAVRKEGLEF
jgi:large subunit ribosomal protein L18